MKVEAKYRGQGTYYPGRIGKDHETRNGTYDVDYDDGEKEFKVAATLIRSAEAGASIPGSPSKSKYTTDSDKANKEKINLNRVRWKIISMPGAACSPMYYLMAYDHFVVLLPVAFFGFLTSFDSSFKWDDSEGQQLYGYNRYWKMETTLFHFKIMYMLLSFPFILLQIPLVKDILTHAKRTGYNRHGVCIAHGFDKQPYSVREEVMQQKWQWSCGRGSSCFKKKLPWRDANPDSERVEANWQGSEEYYPGVIKKKKKKKKKKRPQ
eukprot:FR741495.1.p1 GENE.FR741495.1~~FR741495.1.p1  ORF type:complete len:296 (+),score=65.53 FR741495.1:94-888(+)